MKVRCIRKNANGLDLGKDALDYFNYIYDRNSPEYEKEYRPSKIGFESYVYALKIKGGHISYYIRDPEFGGIYHCPSICFDLIDNRISSCWRIKHNYVENYPNGPHRSHFTSTFFAIKEWVDDPMFLQNYVDGRQTEVSIMEAAAKFIETEFD